MEEIAQVYARSLFEVAGEQDRLDPVHEQLGQFADALTRQPRHGGVPVLALLLDRGEEGRTAALRRRRRAGLHELPGGADRAPSDARDLPDPRPTSTRCGTTTNKLLPVEVTSAVALDPETVESLGRRIGEQTGNEIELSSRVDPDILGGIVLRVGNFIMDASIRSRLEQLRREVAQA